VSTVEAELQPGLGWPDLLGPPPCPAGSVSGAPKAAALAVIGELETEPRGVYRGAVGWVHADTARGVLAVAIRTFDWQQGRLRLGTGAGITWGSDPDREWDETRLKTSRLLEVR
jgi:para-aminobenzoate synthetase component 1